MAYKILSISGGGIRGIYAAGILSRLEEETGKKVHELFDLIVGVSTGGIIACAAGADMSMRGVLNLYDRVGGKVFRRPRGFVSRLWHPKYRNDELQKQLANSFGTTKLKDCKTDVMVTAYNLDRRGPAYLKSWNEFHNGTPLRHVAEATSAAPTYFGPATIRGERYVDGGIICNDPSVFAYAEGSRRAGRMPITLVSLGTGLERLKPVDIKGGGLLGWSRAGVECALDGSNDSAHYVCRRLPIDTYFRINETMINSVEMDDSSEEARKILKNLAYHSYEKYEDRLENALS